MRVGSLCVCAVVAASLGAAPLRAAAPLSVAAASDLQAVMPELATRFEAASGIPLRVSFGSSGQFASQIQNGAPFDVFLSADDTLVRTLLASGAADAPSVVYASARLALWTRTDSGVDISRGLTSLTAHGVRRIAIANPAHAPYGRAAVDALTHAAIYASVASKLVFGENVSQAAQFAQSANADVAIIAMALTYSPAMRASGRTVEIPPATFAPLRQTGAVVARSTRKADARRLLDFLTSADASALLQRSGYGAARP